MTWFRKKEIAATEEHERQVSVEVAHHRKQTAKVAAQTIKTTNDFNKMLQRNGITIKIHLAMRGGR